MNSRSRLGAPLPAPAARNSSPGGSAVGTTRFSQSQEPSGQGASPSPHSGVCGHLRLLRLGFPICKTRPGACAWQAG